MALAMALMIDGHKKSVGWRIERGEKPFTCGDKFKDMSCIYTYS